MDTIDQTIAQAYLDMLKEAKTIKRESWIPEAIADEDVADFMGAAAAAAKAGKKTFKFGDKEYKVTMKKDTVKAIEDDYDGGMPKLPHMMYDPKTGKGHKAETEADHLRMKKMGYTHEPVDENKKAALAKKLAKSAQSSKKGKAAVTLPKAPWDKKNKKESVDEALTEMKKGDTVIPSKGPHAGKPHTIIHDFGDGHYNIKPDGLTGSQIKYRMGAAKAKAADLKLRKESVKEEVELQEGTDLYDKGGVMIKRFAAGKGKGMKIQITVGMQYIQVDAKQLVALADAMPMVRRSLASGNYKATKG